MIFLGPPKYKHPIHDECAMTEVKVDPSEHGSPSLVAHLKSFKVRCGVLAFALLFLLPTFITVPFMLSDPTNPEGMIDYPNEVQMESDGFLMIILDGVGRNQLLDKTQFSGLLISSTV